MEKINKQLISQKAAIFLIAVFLICIAFINIVDINHINKYIGIIINLASVFLIMLVIFISKLRYFLVEYVKNSLNETKKVVWPEKQDIVKTTILVFIFVVLMGGFLWIVDASLGWFIYDIILDWR